MKTKSIMLVLAVITAFSTSAYDFKENGLAYKINEDGTSVEVTFERFTQSGYSNLTGDVVIPSSVSHNGIQYTVTSIGDIAFFRCSGITSVVIPNTVTKISFKSFTECTGLTSLSIPNSVEEIGVAAFRDCNSLSSLHIPGSVSSIGLDAFNGCTGLYSVTVDEGNTIYDSRDNCNAIIETATNTLVLGSNSTVIPNSIDSIYTCAFLGCKGLETVVIPNSVKHIGGNAFSECTSLTHLELGNSVAYIGDGAFSYCYELSSVIIPKSVVSIGERAFGKCLGLSSMVVEDDNPYYDSRDNCNAIIETGTNTLIAGCKNTVIPNTISSIGNYAFYRLSNLEPLTIPNSVLSIGEGAFLDCENLTSVTIPNSVVSVGLLAFSGCKKMTSLKIGSSVSHIGSNAFGGCTNLSVINSRIMEPQNVTYDDSYYIFSSKAKENCVLRVPHGTLELYKSIMPWREFANIVVEGDLNNDGEVTAADATVIYNIMLGNSSAATVLDDVNGDGEVTSADITAIYNILLGNQ